jgi:hypothetical protein
VTKIGEIKFYSCRTSISSARGRIRPELTSLFDSLTQAFYQKATHTYPQSWVWLSIGDCIQFSNDCDEGLNSILEHNAVTQHERVILLFKSSAYKCVQPWCRRTISVNCMTNCCCNCNIYVKLVSIHKQTNKPQAQHAGKILWYCVWNQC